MYMYMYTGIYIYIYIYIYLWCSVYDPSMKPQTECWFAIIICGSPRGISPSRPPPSTGPSCSPDQQWSYKRDRRIGPMR